MLDDLRTKPFEPLTRLETALCEALRDAADSETRKVIVSPSSGSDRRIRATVLRWFLLEAIPSSELPIAGFELHGAEIEGSLDLGGTKIKSLVRFMSCSFRGEFLLTDATLIALHLIGGDALRIFADRISVSGSLAIRARLATDAPMLAAQPGPFVVRNQLRLCGANIRGNLDLRGCQLHSRDSDMPLFADGLIVEGNALLADRFETAGEVRLNGCRIARNLDCSGATLRNPLGYSLSAAGARIAGSVYMSKTRPWPTYPDSIPFLSAGTLRLEGATIEGDLDCTGGEFVSPEFLETPAPKSDDPEKAIAADGIDIGADLILRGGFSARGVVSLIGAHVGGDFGCEGGTFDFPGEQALSADGIAVSGTTFFTEGAQTNGILCFTQASFRQGFYANGAIFHVSAARRPYPRATSALSPDQWQAASEPMSPACGMRAASVTIEGPFRWFNIGKRVDGTGEIMPLWLYLTGSKAESIEDDQRSWELLDRFDVTGCDYSDISNLTGDIRWRVKELDRQYAILNVAGPDPRNHRWLASVRLGLKHTALACRALKRALSRWLTGQIGETDPLGRAVARFVPQPYIQLAKTLRAAGYEAAANDVIVRLERNKTRYSDFGVRRQLGRWSLDLGLRYGFSPFRPVWILFSWALVSAVCFEIAYSHNQIVPTKDNQEIPCRRADKETTGALGRPATQACEAPRVTFDALIYAVDTLVPLVDLNQKKNWVVEPLSIDSRKYESGASIGWLEAFTRAWSDRPDFGPAALVVFNTFFGWLMTTFFAAGITGLLRNGKESA